MSIGNARRIATEFVDICALHLFLLPAPAYAQEGFPGTLVVSVTGLRNAKGHLLVCL